MGGGLEVIGAGFGRTGTLSLKRALEDLGLGPTYHMQEVWKHPSHVREWHRFALTRSTDWDRLFRRYRSGVDFPVSCAWRELCARYPDAKVVLTVRDPERWWASTASTIYTSRTMFPAWLRRTVPHTARYLDMNDRLIWDGLFDGRFEDRDHATEVFRRHIDTVVATVPPERLLVFDVAEGWAPLCRFLGVPEPAHRFPALNDAATTRRVLGAIRIGTRMLPIAGAAAGVAALVLARSRGAPAAGDPAGSTTVAAAR